MQTKMIEIRDAMTFIPALAIKMVAGHEADQYLLRRAGYGGEECILLVHLALGRSNYDPYAWANRTMQNAHLYVCEHFDTMEPACVVDVEYILGLKVEPKRSERHDFPIA